ncbi:hypothetical protein TWF706_011970 [Orbilia oligospora]|nr:hypothetical protein TWF706_011970 [Orbilia oligospora]
MSTCIASRWCQSKVKARICLIDWIVWMTAWAGTEERGRRLELVLRRLGALCDCVTCVIFGLMSYGQSVWGHLFLVDIPFCTQSRETMMARDRGLYVPAYYGIRQ